MELDAAGKVCRDNGGAELLVPGGFPAVCSGRRDKHRVTAVQLHAHHRGRSGLRAVYRLAGGSGECRRSGVPAGVVSGTFQRAEAGLSRGAVAKSSRLYQSGNLRLPDRWPGKLAGQAQVIGDLLELSCAIDTSDGGRSLGQKRFASFQFVRVIEADTGLT